MATNSESEPSILSMGSAYELPRVLIYLHNEAKCEETQDEVENSLFGMAADEVRPLFRPGLICRIFFPREHVLDLEQPYNNWYWLLNVQYICYQNQCYLTTSEEL